MKHREPHLMTRKDLYLALRHLSPDALRLLDDAIDEATESDEFGSGPSRIGLNARRTLACLSYALTDAIKDAESSKSSEA